MIVLDGMRHFAPDILEFGLDHFRRQVELVLGVQLVEEVTLDLHARLLGVLALETLAQRLFQAVETFQAQTLGQLVINLGVLRRFEPLHGDFKHGGLTSQLFGLVVFREGDIELTLFTDLGTDKLLFKARDERTIADRDSCILGRTAFEHFTIQLADEINDDDIALFRLGILAALLGREFTAFIGQTLERLVDFGVLDIGDRTGH